MRYRRAIAAGGIYFFSVNLANRRSDYLVQHIDALRAATKTVKDAHPFEILAMVVLSEHLHAIWRLPADDGDYPLRWSQIKAGFSRRLPKVEHINLSRHTKRERGIWQRRYWEHQIRDGNDLARHVEYIHYNPVKHGLVVSPADWPHSTLHRYIERGMMSPDWGGQVEGLTAGFGER